MARTLPEEDIKTFGELPEFDEQTDIHRLPRKKVLLLTCMDYRLLDNVVKFMNSLNLENRYDQLVFAGAAMGALRLPGNNIEASEAWAKVFFMQLDTAIEKLDRDTRDIFIIEHIDCGAYRVAHPGPATRKLYSEEMDDYAKSTARYDLQVVKQLHCRECFQFKKHIEDHIKAQRGKAWAKLKPINVRCFIMDLAGKVTELIPK